MKGSIEYESRGALVDWTTQRWVQATGRRVALEECSWLEGPVGDVDVIGADFFVRFADREGARPKRWHASTPHSAFHKSRAVEP
jgi:hypothetical protein